ncbi:MAG: hypothetical protein HY562_00830 [Ignavibacteriales bacterium]|nr:hypothetical protein [Ignavibacteriales bacterium]
MERVRSIFVALICGVFAHTETLFSQLSSLETKNLRLISYDRSHAYVVPHLARCFENAFRFHSRLFNFTPTEEVTLLLQDFGDYGNGGATAVPFNLISVGISPFHYAYETSPANERMNALMNHELVHIVALDRSSDSDRMFQSLFSGKVVPTRENPISMLYSYLTTPRRYSPRWYHEGIASFLETWMDGGIGRALGAYDEMVFRTMVRDGAYIYDYVGLESEGTTIDFQAKANSYLYGTRFMTYVAYQYGPERLIEWVSRTDESRRFFASQFEQLFGRSLEQGWSDWISFEHQWQKANLESIRTNPVTPHRTLSPQTLGSVSRAFYDKKVRKIYAAINYPGQVAHIAAINIDHGSVEQICDVKGGALYYVSSLAYDSSAQVLFYTTDNNKWRDLNMVDVKTGESKLLIQDARTGDLAFNSADKSLWGVRHFIGFSTLVRIPPPYTDWNQVYTLPYGKDFFDIDISPNGKTLTGALAEVSGNQKLIRMDVEKLLKGDQSSETIFDFESNSPATFVFSPDGRYSFGTSYYSGVSNVFRYDFEKNSMVALTNCETGYFRPIPVSEDSLIAFNYTGTGFVPVMLANREQEKVSAINFLGQAVVEKFPTVTQWKLDPPSESSINIDSLTTYAGEYRPIDHIKVTSLYPLVEGYKDFASFGFRMNASDPILINEIDLAASYSPNTLIPGGERLHGRLSLHSWRWRFLATYNGADFYDLFGPTKTSRKGYSAGVQYREFLVFDEPKTMDYVVTGTAYWGLERLPDFQNISISTSFDRFLSVSGRLNYQYFLRSLGAVEEETGFRWQAISHNNYVNGLLYPRLLSTFDYGFLLPISHSSLWLRSSAGYSFGKRENPFANFFFGGYGNNWIDYQDSKRYREYYSFPGVELNNIGGTNYGKLMLEWTLPPLRFRRFGIQSFYMNWIHLSFFSSALSTNFDDLTLKRTAVNVGAQIDCKLVIFSTQESTLSIGYAVAKQDHLPASSNEVMISLKLLK